MGKDMQERTETERRVLIHHQDLIEFTVTRKDTVEAGGSGDKDTQYEIFKNSISIVLDESEADLLTTALLQLTR